MAQTRRLRDLPPSLSSPSLGPWPPSLSSPNLGPLQEDQASERALAQNRRLEAGRVHWEGGSGHASGSRGVLACPHVGTEEAQGWGEQRLPSQDGGRAVGSALCPPYPCSHSHPGPWPCVGTRGTCRAQTWLTDSSTLLLCFCLACLFPRKWRR